MIAPPNLKARINRINGSKIPKPERIIVRAMLLPLETILRCVRTNRLITVKTAIIRGIHRKSGTMILQEA